MKILHYTLGFAPERTGGLVRYAMDLMQEQVAQGDEVVALYPGHFRPWQRSSCIVPAKKATFPTYQLINSLPLALSGGIADPSDFMTWVDGGFYREFLEEQKPDLIHLHTIMGLHKECLKAARDLGIPVLMTSHDYFGLAPVPTFYGEDRSYERGQTDKSWQMMSTRAMPTTLLRLFQTPLYPVIRTGVRLLGAVKGKSASPAPRLQELPVTYHRLSSYYQSLFALVDAFHFNSSVAKAVFEAHLWDKGYDSRVLTITHAGIPSSQQPQPWQTPIRLAYVGPDARHKGYDAFLALAQKWQSKQEQFSFQTWGHSPRRDCPSFIRQNGRFSSREMAKVYDSFDVLILPSQWPETFGFTALEAAAHGKMVLASSKLGAKDILPEEWIFQDETDLDRLLNSLQAPTQALPVKSLTEHAHELNHFYRAVIERSR